MGKLYTIRDACKILQLNPNTLRKWDREGKIKCIRPSNNFRRVPESEINRILGIKSNRMSFIYARVSSHDQKADLDRHPLWYRVSHDIYDNILQIYIILFINC